MQTRVCHCSRWGRARSSSRVSTKGRATRPLTWRRQASEVGAGIAEVLGDDVEVGAGGGFCREAIRAPAGCPGCLAWPPCPAATPAAPPSRAWAKKRHRATEPARATPPQARRSRACRREGGGSGSESGLAEGAGRGRGDGREPAEEEGRAAARTAGRAAAMPGSEPCGRRTSRADGEQPDPGQQALQVQAARGRRAGVPSGPPGGPRRRPRRRYRGRRGGRRRGAWRPPRRRPRKAPRAPDREPGGDPLLEQLRQGGDVRQETQEEHGHRGQGGGEAPGDGAVTGAHRQPYPPGRRAGRPPAGAGLVHHAQTPGTRFGCSVRTWDGRRSAILAMRIAPRHPQFRPGAGGRARERSSSCMAVEERARTSPLPAVRKAPTSDPKDVIDWAIRPGAADRRPEVHRPAGTVAALLDPDQRAEGRPLQRGHGLRRLLHPGLAEDQRERHAASSRTRRRRLSTRCARSRP